MADEETGLFQPSCELSQIVAQGLVRPHQVVGVELDREIQNLNIRAAKKVFPRGGGPTLIQGEITRVLDGHLGAGKLFAEVVNLDLVCEPKEGVKILARTMDILNHIYGPTMLVWNIILSRTWPKKRAYSWADVATLLDSDSLLRSVRPHGWDQFGGKVFPYGGTGNSSTTMGTVVFVRRGPRVPTLGVK